MSCERDDSSKLREFAQMVLQDEAAEDNPRGKRQRCHAERAVAAEGASASESESDSDSDCEDVGTEGCDAAGCGAASKSITLAVESNLSPRTVLLAQLQVCAAALSLLSAA